MGAVLREQNALPYEYLKICSPSAKDDVNNVGAGRAAKGATPTTSTNTRKRPFSGVFLRVGEGVLTLERRGVRRGTQTSAIKRKSYFRMLYKRVTLCRIFFGNQDHRYKIKPPIV